MNEIWQDVFVVSLYYCYKSTYNARLYRPNACMSRLVLFEVWVTPRLTVFDDNNITVIIDDYA